MGLKDGAGPCRLLGKGVRRERQRPEARVVALAVVWTRSRGGCGKPEAGEARAGGVDAGRRSRRRAERGGGVEGGKGAEGGEP